MSVAMPRRSRKPDNNPYVGPRPFRSGEAFYGREREASGLLHNLLASRILLLHARSGAGKTSLIQAAIVPEAEKLDFQICAALDPRFTAVRVNALPPDGVDVKNRYVYSAVFGLIGHLREPAELATWTLGEALSLLADQLVEQKRQLVFFDQLEEVLNLDPTDVEGQHEFFRQLGLALDDPNRWSLLAIREDYMGGLDGYARYLPGQLRSTFRLDLLDKQAAQRAIQLPARGKGVEFEDDAVELIIADLSQVFVQTPDAAPVSRPGHFVEPVLLQAMCDGLWREARKGGRRFTRITKADVHKFGQLDARKFGKLDAALARYYRTVMGEATGNKVPVQHALRNWVEEYLITEQHFRSQTRNPPPAGLQTMKDRYLIRDDPRPNGTWLELAHDRLIEPIIKDNAIWRVRHLAPWQLDAWEWRRHRDDETRLLNAEAHQLAVQSDASTRLDYESEFIEASGKHLATRRFARKMQRRLLTLQAAVMFSSFVNICLLVALIIVLTT